MATNSSGLTRAPLIRPVQAVDLEPLKVFLGELSPGSLYFRFGKPHVPLWSDEQWAELCQPDTKHTTGLVAVEVIKTGQYAIVGMARLVTDARRKNAEFSVVLADRKQQQGIGTRLIHALVTEAQRRALTTIYGDVLPTNHAMIRFCEGLGMEINDCPVEARLSRMVFRIQDLSCISNRTTAAQTPHTCIEIRAA